MHAIHLDDAGVFSSWRFCSQVSAIQIDQPLSGIRVAMYRTAPLERIPLSCSGQVAITAASWGRSFRPWTPEEFCVPHGSLLAKENSFGASNNLYANVLNSPKLPEMEY
ncbi:hypothetical protein MGG_11166 [Pyricularia oryzae 70-15]|uniref:Uncharacterized protein n=1 Tax=Pyricularia oryzae (strain 70-15 / ATCC MYA-4617 / FGSC 8958) TaxID=242507 RepID=G4MUU5_PYRO7|nr:uncharacterized protein MGG_11166 [Pyricularia oryzae 70-15]EHA54875.1 hypothetical protein MGG_11166 [Pyricularia oryzae 70-15]